MGAVTIGLCKSQARATAAGGCPQLFAESLVLFQLGPVLVDFLQGLLTGAPAAFQLLQGSTQKAAAQRAPRDQSQTVVPAGGNDLQLHHAVVQVVDALFAGQPIKPRLEASWQAVAMSHPAKLLDPT